MGKNSQRVEILSDEVKKEVYPTLLYLLENIKNLDDEVYRLSLESLSYINRSNKYRIIDLLEKHKDNSIEKVVELIYELSVRKIFIDYKKEKLIEIIDFAYSESDLKSINNKICHEYRSAGFEFLRDVFKKYNS